MALDNQMMDAYADIRESIQGQGALNDDFFTPGFMDRLKTFGYTYTRMLLSTRYKQL